MALTPEQISNLSTFGKIPAETRITNLGKGLLQDSMYFYPMAFPFTHGSTTIYYTGNSSISTIDVSSIFNNSVSTSPFRTCQVVLMVMFNYRLASGDPLKISCTYTSGTTSATTKTVNVYDGLYAPAAFTWLVTAENIANNAKFKLFHSTSGQTSTSFGARYAIIVFPMFNSY